MMCKWIGCWFKHWINYVPWECWIVGKKNMNQNNFASLHIRFGTWEVYNVWVIVALFLFYTNELVEFKFVKLIHVITSSIWTSHTLNQFFFYLMHERFNIWTRPNLYCQHLKQFPFPRDSSLATSWQSSRSMVLIGSLSWNAIIYTHYWVWFLHDSKNYQCWGLCYYEYTWTFVNVCHVVRTFLVRFYISPL